MKHLKTLLLFISLISMMLIVACASAQPVEVSSSTDIADSAETAPTEDLTIDTSSDTTESAEAIPTEETTVEDSPEAIAPEVSMRESGLQVTVQDLGDVIVHSLTAPEQVFANSTHIIETPNSLVLIDTQFILPMALDYRAYADSLGKPIEQLVITHEHPDHFLGSEAFADIEIYALAEVSDAIAAHGQAEVDEKQGEFGDAIASTFVVPTVLEPGSVEIDDITFIFEVMENAEAEIQVVTKVPEYGIVSVGDIVYSGLHLILAGSPPTWTEALEALKAERADYPIVLAGHGVPGGPDLYDQNMAWLAKAGELLGTVSSGEEFKAGLVQAFPDLGMDAAIDFVLPFLFSTTEGESNMGLIEVITVELAEGATIEEFLPTNQVIKDDYASKQPGYLARETAVSEDGLLRLAVHWESKADSDASIAGFGDAPGLEAFMSNLNPETMVIKQYELRSSTSGQATFPGAGVTEVITVKLLDGADADGFVTANQALEESYIVKQPGFIAREVGVTEDGEWIIVVHWETAEDSAASIAKFEKAPGVETFMSFLDMETMTNTVYAIQPLEEVTNIKSTPISDLTVFPLPERSGSRTQTSGIVPHVQINVETVTAVNDELFRRAFALPGVEDRPTIVSLSGTRGMWLSEDISLVHPEAIVSGREFAHIHPDGSLHAPLPYERALEVAEKGWGERHPWADEQEGWDGLVMLFTPQSMDELDITFQLIVESYNHVTGQTIQASDFQ